MTDFTPQSTDFILGNANRESKVIYRGRISLITATQGSGSAYAPYYYAEHTKDISFLNTTGVFPAVEVWRKTGTAGSITFIKCPYAFVDPGTLNIAEYVKVQVNQQTSKSGGYTLGLTLALFHKTQNITRELYYTIYSDAIGATDSSLFIDDGTFSG